MAPPLSFANWRYNDNTVKSNGEPESATFTLAIPTLTAGNVAATATLVGNLTTAISALVLGVLAQTELVFEREVVASTPAASQLAQRENKLLLRYHGITAQKKFRASIPTLDLTTLIPNSEFLDLTAGDGLALKTAFEAVVRSPDDASETVILDSAQFVGRNS